MISLHKAYQKAKKYAHFMYGDTIICGLSEDKVSWIFNFCQFVPGLPNGDSLSWSLARLNQVYGHVPGMYGGREAIRVFKEDGRLQVLYGYIEESWEIIEGAEELEPKNVFEERKNSKYDFVMIKEKTGKTEQIRNKV